MRILATWRPGDAPTPDEATVELLDECGWLEPGQEFSTRWDPREEEVEAADEGWIGEDGQGVWTRLHPLSALAQDEELWTTWTAWKFGQREITRQDFETLSNFELEARAVMMAADAREQRRRMKARGDEE